MELALELLRGGLTSLASYLAAHVLLCLVPAFFIAGALSALVPRESITPWLGPAAPKYVAYPAAAAAGSVLAVCSCTVVPLFAGIYRKGAGLGPAVTFLFFAPAGNILALSYTGVVIGPEFAVARVLLSLSFGIGIGMIMAMLFAVEDTTRVRAPDSTFAGSGALRWQTVIFLALLVALLLAGTQKLQPLEASAFEFTLPWAGAAPLQVWLDSALPHDAARGVEGVSVQGLLLIALLALIALLGPRGLGKADEALSRWTWAALVLVCATLVLAAMLATPTEQGLEFRLTGRTLAVVVLLAALPILARRWFDAFEIGQWLWETWRFVKDIFPVLVLGVFLVGVARELIRPEWIQALAGANTLTANLAGVGFGVFMYFPTLVEVPVAKMFLSMGMHPGPLLAYLMADPELSLQSILMITAVIGRAKAWSYVVLVAVFSTVAGLTFGAWHDGMPVAALAAVIATFLALLAGGLAWWQHRSAAASPRHTA